jgi:threonyl-tRNA synthetase
VGGLIEHFGGRFPFWLAPEQIALIPIREEQADTCRAYAQELRAAGLRVRCMDDPGHMNKKIKLAQHDQVPFMGIVGEREAQDGTLALRRRGTREQEVLGLAEFLAAVTRLRDSRSLELELQ